MAYAVSILPSAERQLAALPEEIRQRLSQAIVALADEPRPAPPLGRKIQGQPTRYRLRIGHYRVVYQVDRRDQLVVVSWIGLGRDAYR